MLLFLLVVRQQAPARGTELFVADPSNIGYWWVFFVIVIVIFIVIVIVIVKAASPNSRN